MRFLPACTSCVLGLWLPMSLAAAIQWTGVSQLPQDQIRFSLVDEETESRSKWIPLGSVFAGYVLADFDAENEVLVLQKDEETLRLKLQAAVIKEEKAQEAEPVSLPRAQYESMTDESLRSHGLQRVRQGDTMAKIARETGLRVSDVIALNPGVQPTRLRIGQILRLRPNSPMVQPPAPETDEDADQ